MNTPNLIHQMNTEERSASTSEKSNGYSDLLLVLFPFISIFYALRSNRYFSTEDALPPRRFWMLLGLGYSIWAVSGFFTLRHLNFFE